MKKNYRLVLMDIATDGTTSSGMGGSTEVSTAAIITSSEPTVINNTITSEADALSFLNGTTSTNDDANNTVPVNPNEPVEIEPFDIGEIDMSMFGLSNEPVIPVVPQLQAGESVMQPIINAQNEISESVKQAQMIQDIYNKLNNPASNDPQIAPEEMTALSALTEKLQQAGLLPKGLSDEDRTLLQEAKTLRDEIKLQKEQQAQQVEFNNKVNTIDSYSKQLEGLIPGYNTEFMVNLVSQISAKNPQAGQQILNNPAMLTQLWATYGAKAQPKQQQSNIISGGNITNNGSDLFEKVKAGNASIDDEARYLQSL